MSQSEKVELSNPEHFARLTRMYLSAPTNQHYSELTMEVAEGKADVSIRVAANLHHAAMAMHGSHYFKLMDDAAFFAANSLVKDVFVVTASFSIELYRPVLSGRVFGKGQVNKFGKTLIFASAELTDEKGKLLGRGSGTFARSPLPLSQVPSYA